MSTSKTITFRTPFTQTIRVSTVNNEPSLTVKEALAETDINNIIKKFEKGEYIDHYNRHEGYSGVHTGLDYKQSLDIVHEANRMFSELPSEARNYFENNPEKFLNYVHSEEFDVNKMHEIGLTKKPPLKEGVMRGLERLSELDIQPVQASGDHAEGDSPTPGGEEGGS